MTEELKPHQIAQLVNKLRDIATKYHAHGCLRELISREVNAALTQRPAAQAGEVELAFDQGWRMAAEWANRDDLIPDMDSPHYAKERSDRLASLPAQPAAQDEREADEVFLPRRLAATQKLTQLGYRYDSAHGKWLPAPQQATPAGEFKRINCKVNGIDGTAEVRRVDENTVDIGRVVAFADEQKATPEPEHDMAGMLARGAKAWAGVDPQELRTGGLKATPEPVGEVVYQIKGEAFECPHAWRDATEEAFYTTPAADRRIVYTRPAPGVPEGFDVQAHVATGGGHEYPLITVRDTSTQVGEDVFPDEHPVIYGLLSAALAAAQAKGADK